MIFLDIDEMDFQEPTSCVFILKGFQTFKTIIKDNNPMKFKVPVKKHANIPKYPSGDFDLARKFSKMLHKEMGDFIKAVVLFGSTAREEKPLYGERDIDLLV